MNAFQKCPNTCDAVPLYLPQQLYLKPIARINISVQLTQKVMGKTIMHHDVMEQLRDLIKPDEFTLLKVIKTTLEIIRFEAEVEHKKHVHRVVSKLENKMIKLKNFTELMRVKAGEAKLDFPMRHDWDTYFREAKDVNEMKPGERPDTVHIANLPTKWFIPYRSKHKDDITYPSEKTFYCTFEKFGSIRNVDIPICDPYRSKMKSHITGIQTSSFDETEFFEGYIQFKDYIGFTKCMDALRGMKLLRKLEGEALTINIYVDFDKSKHLSEASIRRRNIVRDRMVLKQREKEEKEKEVEEEKKKNELEDRQKQIDFHNEKEKRRRDREEKRKAKNLAKLKVKETDEISEKIAKEEKKLVKVQRRLEAIRLVEELFKRINNKLVKADKGPKTDNSKQDELSRMKSKSENEVKTQQDKLHSAIKGRVILKSIISGQAKSDSDSSSESSLISEEDPELRNDNIDSRVYPPMGDLNWYNYLHNMQSYAVPPFINSPRGYPYYMPRGRGAIGGGSSYSNRFNNRGRGRGANQSQENHRKPPVFSRDYRNKRFSRSYTKSRSRSRSRARYSKSRSRSRSYRRSRTPSRSRSRRRSRSSRRSRSRRRSWSRRSNKRPQTRTPSPRRSKRRSNSRSSG